MQARIRIWCIAACTVSSSNGHHTCTAAVDTSSLLSCIIPTIITMQMCKGGDIKWLCRTTMKYAYYVVIPISFSASNPYTKSLGLKI